MATEPLPCALPDADPGLPHVPGPAAGPCPPEHGRLRRLAGRIGPVLIGAAVVAVAVASGSGVTQAVGRIGHMHTALLWAAVAAEAGSYVWLSLHLRLLAGPRANQRRAAPLRTALVVFGLGSVLPAAPAEGVVIATASLRRRRLQPRRIAVLLGFSQWFATRGLLAVVAVDAVVAAAAGHLPGPWRSSAVAGAVALGALLTATTWLSLRRWVAEAVSDAYLWVRHRRHPLTRAERRRRGAAWHAVAAHVTGDRRQRASLIATTAASWVCDGACLMLALRATGAHVSPDQLLFAYAVGTLASNVPLLPAGIGVVETLTPLLLTRFGVGWGDALTAVLVYRLLGTVAPAIGGVLAAALLRVEGDPDHAGPDPVAPPALSLAVGAHPVGANPVTSPVAVG